MQVTFEEVSQLCFVVFSPAVSVCGCLFVSFHFYKAEMKDIYFFYSMYI